MRRFRPAAALVLLTIIGVPAITPSASQAATSTPSVVVIDPSGIDASNPNFASNVIDEVCLNPLAGIVNGNVACPNNSAFDEGPGAALPQANASGAYIGSFGSHGTAVASVVAGKLGTDPSANLILIRNLYSTSAALDWVVQHVAQYDIVSVVMSGGALISIPGVRDYVPCDQLTETVGARQISLAPDIAALRTSGVAFVVASGNDSNDMYIQYPACMSGVVSVGATWPGGGVAPFSDISPTISILAPGQVPVAEEATLGDYQVSTQIGTSFAAPAVAGAFAALRAEDPGLSVDQALAVLRATGTPVNDVVVQHIPALNLPAALAFLQAGTSIPSLASTFVTQTILNAPGSSSTPGSGTSSGASASSQIASLQASISKDQVVMRRLRHEINDLKRRRRPR